VDGPVRKIFAIALGLTLWAASAQAFTWRTSKEAVDGSSTTTMTITEPTGIANGDYEFMVADMPNTTLTLTTPTGWTQVFTALGSATRVYVFAVTGGRGASAPTLAFTKSATTNGTEWHSLAFSGSNATIDASGQTTVTTGTTPDPPSATATFTNDEAIAIGMGFSGSSTAWTAPTGYTIRSINTAGLDLAVASKDLSASGAENPSTFTGAAGSNNIWAATILVENSSPTSGGATTHPCTGMLLAGVGCEASR
jgi:hypothetical protein